MQQIELPVHSDRYIGCTVPRAGEFYVCDYDEVWRIVIGDQAIAELTDLEPYAFADGNPDFLGWWMEDKNAIKASGGSSITYQFKAENDITSVQYQIDDQSGAIEFPTFSGDWFAGSLSDDGAYLVLAEPYRIELYRFR